MPKYKVGDIVSVLGLKDILFIIAGTINSNEGFLYRMIKVYPVDDIIFEYVVNDEGINTELSLKKEHEKFPYLVRILDEEYKSIGYIDFIDFLDEVAATLEEEDNSRIINNSIKMITEMEDAIFYHEIKSITECTKAMIDLKELFMRFGDEAYLQLHELVVNRFESIIRYVKDTDELLDVMNDLKELHELYGDEEYRRLYTSVLNQLAEMG